MPFEGKCPVNAKLQKSITASRLQTAKAEYDIKLETKRRKLQELFERENAEYAMTYADLLQLKERARKEAVIDEANKLRKSIITKTAEIAKREYTRLLNQNNEEYRLCRPTIFNKLTKEDQEAINEYKKQQKTYEKSREAELLQQGNNFSANLFTADDDRTQNRINNRRLHQIELLKQISEKEKDCKLIKNKESEEEKNMKGVLQTETDTRKQEEIVRKRQLYEDLKAQLEEMKLRKKRNKERDVAIEKLFSQYWMPISSSKTERIEAKDLKNQLKSFLEYQYQIRDHQNRQQFEIDRIVFEMAEKLRIERNEREKARRCYLRKLETENNESNRQAAFEVLARQVQEAQKSKEEARELAEIQQQHNELEKQIKSVEEAKRTELRMNLEKQMEELRLRKEYEEMEKKMEEGNKKESFKKYCKCSCENINLNAYNLHPWRKAILKKM
ncbi:unnamed protein product [Hymenolepis diminuta]|uniref:Trichohyalin-plectin-homology domain-containing protein n=1 Tax=Hymenolepis diminuta TaxID=6216 RepID=A0A0R3STS2_HYMDI|nr:unnamed protein product [Hymenolepis diminuta]